MHATTPTTKDQFKMTEQSENVKRTYYNLVRYRDGKILPLKRSYLRDLLRDQREKYNEIYKLTNQKEVTHHVWDDETLKIFESFSL